MDKIDPITLWSVPVKGLRIVKRVANLLRNPVERSATLTIDADASWHRRRHCYHVRKLCSGAAGKSRHVGTAAPRLATPGIEINVADNSAGRIGDSLALGYRLLMDGAYSRAILNRQQPSAEVNIATSPNTARIDLSNHLPAQH